MSDFFTELEEDIKDERILSLWKKYGNMLIGIALLIILSTTGYTLWTYWQRQKQMEKAASFSSAVSLLKQGNQEAAHKAFQNMGKERGGYGKLSLFYEASLLKDGSKVYGELITKNKKDAPFLALAKILSALENPSHIKEVESLGTPENMWSAMALELLALADVSQGKSGEALKKFAKIIEDPGATPLEKTRARMMMIELNGKMSSAQK